LLSVCKQASKAKQRRTIGNGTHHPLRPPRSGPQPPPLPSVIIRINRSHSQPKPQTPAILISARASIQGFHNLSTANHVLPDPLLTELGQEQCRTLRDTFPYHDRVELVTASPLRRTLYTALLGFEPVFHARRGMKLIALPEAQETSDVPCDCGSDPEALRREFVEEKGLPVDLERVEEGWNSKVRFAALQVLYLSYMAAWAGSIG